MLHLGSITRKKVSDFAPPAPVPFTESFTFSHDAGVAHSLVQDYTPPVTPHKYIIISFFANFINWKEATAEYSDYMWIPFSATRAACYGLGNMYERATAAVGQYRQITGCSLVSAPNTAYGTYSNTLTLESSGFVRGYFGGTPQDRWVHVYAVVENTPDATKQRMWLGGVEYSNYNLTSSWAAATAKEFNKLYLSSAAAASTAPNKSIKMSSICIHGCDDLNMPFDIFNPDEFMPQFVMDDGTPRKVAFSPNIFLNQLAGSPLMNQVNSVPLTTSNCTYSVIAETANIKYEGSYITSTTGGSAVIESNRISPTSNYYYFLYAQDGRIDVANGSVTRVHLVGNVQGYPAPSTTQNYYMRDLLYDTSKVISISLKTNENLNPFIAAINGSMVATPTLRTLGGGSGSYYTTIVMTGKIILAAVYDAATPGVNWDDVVALDKLFIDEVTNQLKEGGRNGAGFIKDSGGNSIKPLFFMDARYGYAQAAMQTPSGVVRKTPATFVTFSTSATATPVAHTSTGSPIVRGDVLP